VVVATARRGPTGPMRQGRVRHGDDRL